MKKYTIEHDERFKVFRVFMNGKLLINYDIKERAENYVNFCKKIDNFKLFLENYNNEKFNKWLVKLCEDLYNQYDFFSDKKSIENLDYLMNKIIEDNEINMTIEPHGFSWTDKNTKDNNWGRGETK